MSETWLNWPRAAGVRVDAERVHVELRDGRVISMPFGLLDFLANATDEQRQDFRIIGDGDGIWWEKIDEGVSIPGLLGLPEYPPPDPKVTRYVFDYRFDGEAWDAALRGTTFSTWGRSLPAAKRRARELLRGYLNVKELDGAGIGVVDEVHSAEPVEA